MGAGQARMNRAVVRRAAAGLVAYLKEKVGDDALLVVGYDARHHSADFATDTAAIAAAAGIRAQIMPRATRFILVGAAATRQARVSNLSPLPIVRLRLLSPQLPRPTRFR